MGTQSEALIAVEQIRAHKERVQARVKAAGVPTNTPARARMPRAMACQRPGTNSTPPANQSTP